VNSTVNGFCFHGTGFARIRLTQGSIGEDIVCCYGCMCPRYQRRFSEHVHVHVQTFSHGNTSSFHHDLVLISIFIHLLLVFCRKRACVQVQTFVGAESVPAGPVVDGVQEWNIPAVSQVASTIAVGRQGCVSATHSCPVSQTRARARAARLVRERTRQC
jgi:hypothetical protein